MRDKIRGVSLRVAELWIYLVGDMIDRVKWKLDDFYGR